MAAWVPPPLHWHRSSNGSGVEYRCAKFHLVDLAGSERTKRSRVVGARFKETVGINQVQRAGSCAVVAASSTCPRWNA
jgi:hypothetical protein